METNDKRIEKFVDRLMSNDQLETTSSNFTGDVLSKIEHLSASKATVYKPLIPKPVWWVLGLGLVGLFVYMFMVNPQGDYSITETLGLSLPEFNPFQNIDVSFSKTLVYAIVLPAIMLSVQIPLLKHYVNRHLGY